MSDANPAPQHPPLDDELRQAISAAFGEDALSLLESENGGISPEQISEMMAMLAELPAGAELADDRDADAADADSDCEVLNGSEECPDFPEDPSVVSQPDIELLCDQQREQFGDDVAPLFQFANELNRAIYGKSDSALDPASCNETDSRSNTRFTISDRYVVFSIGEATFALPLSEVGEIARLESVTPLPRTHDWLRGVINLRGDVYSVTDLRVLLGLKGERPVSGEKLIIVRSAGYSTGTAIVVDRVSGIRTIKEFQNPSSKIDCALESVVTGVATVADTPTLLISADGLFELNGMLDFA